MEKVAKKDPQTLVFSGPVVHSTEPSHLSIVENAILVVKSGKIACLEDFRRLNELKQKYGFQDKDIHQLSKGQFIMPGMIDTHVHASQYPNVGLGYDKTLLEWLEAYTFPLEATYEDTQIAARIYEAVIRRTLSAGTTTACYFATIHEESSLILANLAKRLGQRSLIGKVNMNVNHPTNYGETTQQSMESTERFIQQVLALNTPLVQPVITPRFAITCDAELMKYLGDLARKHNVHVQTHISETIGEIAAVKEQYPQYSSYADVYDQAGLLTNKTILAHGIYLTDEELKLLAIRGTSIAHCPNSNISILSGMCDVRRLMENHIKVGLGTDMSGGYGHSILDAMRHALSVSACISFNRKDYKPLTYEEVFHLATLGGAQSLAMDSVIGNFKEGKYFDAIIIDMNLGPSELLSTYSTTELVQKFIYLADDRNISKVFIGGRVVKQV